MAVLYREDGQIGLSWTQSGDVRVVGYDVYRKTSPFDDIAQAAQLNTAPLSVNCFDDMPVPDGPYYYRVVAVNGVGTPSLASLALEPHRRQHRRLQPLPGRRQAMYGVFCALYARRMISHRG